ncbi:MAG: hypothetical protein CL388_06615 [Acidiferrobacteraceae bacterium]|jgi:molybdopterin-biosynthesis enzyme MoeA-like protein|nr:hypothetical protein [Acidiferrobacteraceae bacterium]
MPLNKLQKREVNPAVVTVGDEILYGERRNLNQEWLLSTLWNLGCPATTAVMLPDDESSISSSIKRLKEQDHLPILTSGGIGGTHDDVTRQGIAAALNLPLARHDECFEFLKARYGPDFTPQRERMTQLPKGCELIDNPIGAPGFYIGGVYAFPGFPNMLRPMAELVLSSILPHEQADEQATINVSLPLPEWSIAMEVESFSKQFPPCQVGVYPSTKQYSRETTIRLRYPSGQKEIRLSFEALILSFEQTLAVTARWSSADDPQK